ncbi:hypothetical protein FRC11_004776, partial [Ceratobasidium sp. 423]
MFVLQDCPICFEDFDAERQPHSIPCGTSQFHYLGPPELTPLIGHVFCQPCLESLVSSSPQCPNCRVSYSSASIRKVICTLQEQESGGQANAAQEPEAETLMWQAIQSAIETPQDLKQRKSVVQNNPEDAMLAAGMPKNVLTALALMRFLVQVEEKNSSLKDKLNTSWAVEESLRYQVLRLEAKLSLAGTNTCSSSEHFKLLLDDVRQLQSAVEVINKNTSETARHLSAKSEPPTPRERPVETPERRPPPPAPVPVPEPAPTPILGKQGSRPGILRKSPPQDPSSSAVTSPVGSPTASRISLGLGNPPRQEPLGPAHHRYPSTPTPARQLMSPPMTPAVLPEPLDGSPLFGQTAHLNRWKTVSLQANNTGHGSTSTEQVSHPQSPPMVRHLSMTVAPALPRTQMGHLSMPIPSIPLNPTNSNFVQPRPAPTPTPTQPPPYQRANAPLPVISSPAPAPTPKPQSRLQTLTAVFDFSANSSTELSLKNGQKLYLLPESDTNKEWIWCRDGSGKTGLFFTGRDEAVPSSQGLFLAPTAPKPLEIEIALGLLRTLVSTEEEEVQLKEKLKTVGDKEETLVNRISLLEDELKELKDRPNLRPRPTPKLTPKPTIRDAGNETSRASASSSSAQAVEISGVATSGSPRTRGRLTLAAMRSPREHQNGTARGSRPPTEVGILLLYYYKLRPYRPNRRCQLNPGRAREGNRTQFDRRGPERSSRGNTVRAETTVVATTGRRACGACTNRTTLRGPTVRPTTSESEEEKALWATLKTITEVDCETRNLFIKEHPANLLKEGKMSEYIQIAAGILRLLVRTERENRKLKSKLKNTAEIQEKMVISNSLLEDKLRKAELRILARTPRVRPPPRVPQLVATQDAPDISKFPPDTQAVEGLGQPVPERQATNRMNTPEQSQGRCRYESCIPVEFNSKQITREDHTRFACQNPERDAHGNMIRYPTIAAAIRSYAAEGKNELSLNVGEWLDLFPDTNLGPRREWI